MSVALTLEDEIDISRGDVIVRPGNVPKLEDKFDAMVVWMAEQPLVPGQQYIIKHTTRNVPGTISTLRYQIDVNTMKSNPAMSLELNQIGRVDITLNRAIAYDRYRRNKHTGAFIIIDRISNVTVGAGMILDQRTSKDRNDAWETDPSSKSLVAEISNVTSEERTARYGQKPVTILFTGLPGAGKTTTAYGVERRLFDMGRSSAVLDGQNLRVGLTRDLGFTREDRSENVRRAIEVSRLMNKSGLITMLALVAPSDEIRKKAAQAIGEDFILVHLTAPPELCAQRNQSDNDPDGKVESTLDYQTPADADLVLETDSLNANECVERVIELLVARKYIS
jgi:bifunctional enzyme CysN/CysC